MWKAKSTPAKRITALAAGTLLIIAAAAAPALRDRGLAGRSPLSATAEAARPARSEKSKRTVDGSQTPDQIPDHVAYAMIFRVVANRQSEEQKRGVRSYIAQLGLGRQACESCPVRDGKKADEPDQEIEAVVQAAEEYHRQVSALDLQAKAIKDLTWQNPTPEARARLAELQGRKESLAESVAASLEERLGKDAAARLRHSLRERVKRLTKMRVR